MPASDRLALLRRLDPFHSWHSLDDHRRCTRCGKIIDGHQVDLTPGADGNPAARCPSEGRDGEPDTWSYSASAGCADSKPDGQKSEFSFL